MDGDCRSLRIDCGLATTTCWPSLPAGIRVHVSFIFALASVFTDWAVTSWERASPDIYRLALANLHRNTDIYEKSLALTPFVTKTLSQIACKTQAGRRTMSFPLNAKHSQWNTPSSTRLAPLPCVRISWVPCPHLPRGCYRHAGLCTPSLQQSPHGRPRH